MFETTATRQETRCLAHLCNSSSAPPTSFASRPAAYPIMTLFHLCSRRPPHSISIMIAIITIITIIIIRGRWLKRE